MGLSVIKLFAQGQLRVQYKPENIRNISNQEIPEVRQFDPTWNNNQ